ncbi:MAG: amidase, partial [Vulcanimicrobiaceae bacterium]
VAALLRRAGTIALGKLNTYEFATGGQELFGEPRNPWNLAYSTGGSSTGPAAAVAGRLTPLALGTDTGGSIRMPSSFCGIVGLRPTRGRVPREGLVTLSETFDEVGPMTRTARDCALLFQALTGDEPPAQRGVDRIRVGVPTRLWAECDPEIRAAYDAAIETMRGFGASIVSVALPNAEYGPAASWALSFTEALASHRDRIAAQRQDYTSGFLAKIGGAECITPEDIQVATTIGSLITNEFVDALAGVDAIALPTTPYPAYPLGQQHEQADNSVFVRPVSCSGLPGLSIPCGLTNDGLPIGLQLVGKANGERTLFGVADTFERGTSFVRRPPDIATPAKTGDYWSVVKAQLARFAAS